MAVLSRSSASLRIFGDDLIPNEISAILGVEPTVSSHKGQEIISAKTGRMRIARTGAWRLDNKDLEPGDLSAQILDLLRGLSEDSDVWRGLREKYQIDIFAGLFMENWNEGEVLSAAAMYALGLRGIPLGLDIYGPDDESSDDDI